MSLCRTSICIIAIQDAIIVVEELSILIMSASPRCLAHSCILRIINGDVFLGRKRLRINSCLYPIEYWIACSNILKVNIPLGPIKLWYVVKLCHALINALYSLYSFLISSGLECSRIYCGNSLEIVIRSLPSFVSLAEIGTSLWLWPHFALR